MTYTDDQLKKITTLGTLGYPASKCANILEIADESQFFQDFFDKESPVFKAYQKGVDISDYALDSKLLELAKSGDTSALSELTKRKKLYASQTQSDFETAAFRNM